MEIKFSFKTILYIILIVLTVVSAFFIVSNIKQKNHIDDLQNEIKIKGDSIITFKDHNGLLVSRVGIYEKTIGELKKYNDSIERKMLKESKNNGIKDNKIKELEYILIGSKDSICVILDSVEYLKAILNGYAYGASPEDYNIKFNNGFLDATVNFTTNTSSLKYKYNTEIFKTTHIVRPKSRFFLFRWLGISFRKKEVVSDYKCSDSNARILDVREIIIKK